MTTNVDRAAEVIEGWVAREYGYPEDNAESAAQALADADLLMPDQLRVEAQYHRNYETGRYERHTRTVGEWVKD